MKHDKGLIELGIDVLVLPRPVRDDGAAVGRVCELAGLLSGHPVDARLGTAFSRVWNAGLKL